MEPQYWWLIAGVALIILEIFTPTFFAASLGIGAFAAALTAFLGGTIELQLLLFSLVSVISVFVFRPLITKYLYAAKEVPTNADAMIGRIGNVVKEVDHFSGQGRLALDGDEWQFTTASANISKGDKVRVIARNSIILIVEPFIIP